MEGEKSEQTGDEEANNFEEHLPNRQVKWGSQAGLLYAPHTMASLTRSRVGAKPSPGDSAESGGRTRGLLALQTDSLSLSMHHHSQPGPCCATHTHSPQAAPWQQLHLIWAAHHRCKQPCARGLVSSQPVIRSVFLSFCSKHMEKACVIFQELFWLMTLAL